MKAEVGVSIELVSCAAILATALSVPQPFPLSLLALLIAQVSASVLLHCPAHFLVGSAVGIRFEKLDLRPTTMARSLPAAIRPLASLAVVPSLRTEKGSLRNVAPRHAWAMFMSGVVVSNAAVLLLAAWSLVSSAALVSGVAWLFAVVYLLSDIALSPRSGDVMRARASMRRRAIPAPSKP
jgi:hypothetical protein